MVCRSARYNETWAGLCCSGESLPQEAWHYRNACHQVLLAWREKKLLRGDEEMVVEGEENGRRQGGLEQR